MTIPIWGENDQYKPKTARERVIVYQLLSNLKDLIGENKTHILGVIPIVSGVPKDTINDWIKACIAEMEREQE